MDIRTVRFGCYRMWILLVAISPKRRWIVRVSVSVFCIFFSFCMFRIFLLGDANYGVVGTNNFLVMVVCWGEARWMKLGCRGRIDDLPSINLYKMYQFFSNTLHLPQIFWFIARFLALAQRLAFPAEVCWDFLQLSLGESQPPKESKFNKRRAGWNGSAAYRRKWPLHSGWAFRW